MPEIDRYQPEDQRGIEALYRRVFGTDAAAASRLRWDWQYRRNPNNPGGTPLLWVVREGPTIIGHYATMPVRLSLGGKEIPAAWGNDAMVTPERQRRGLGEELFRTWDRSVGASLGLGLSDASSRLLKKLHFPEVPAIPGLVKPLTRRAVRLPQWPMAINRLRVSRHAADRSRGRPRSAASSRCRADSPIRLRRSPSCGSVWPIDSSWRFAAMRVPELEVHRTSARPIFDRRADPQTAARKAMPSTGTRRSREGASRCSSIFSPIRTMKSDSRRSSDGWTLKRAWPDRTRFGPTRRISAFGGSCGTPGISR